MIFIYGGSTICIIKFFIFDCSGRYLNRKKLKTYNTSKIDATKEIENKKKNLDLSFIKIENIYFHLNC